MHCTGWFKESVILHKKHLKGSAKGEVTSQVSTAKRCPFFQQIWTKKDKKKVHITVLFAPELLEAILLR